MSNGDSAGQLTDPAFFSRLDSIELRARGIVEGFLQGLHRSPFVGFSVEFAPHREYAPGDDLRHLNWKLYARQKRLYVKEFDAETNMNLYLILDVSRSMTCANSGISKLDYGLSLASALAYLALRQHDAVGITLYADRVLSHVPPRSRLHQMDEIYRAMESTTARPVSNAARALPEAAELAPHRGMAVLISDLFDDLPAIVEGLERLCFRGHEVILFQIFDPWERHLPLDGNVRFRDLETGEEISTQADGVREAYLRRMNEWCQTIQRECQNRAIERVELTTDQPLDKALLDYLVHRAKQF